MDMRVYVFRFLLIDFSRVFLIIESVTDVLKLILFFFLEILFNFGMWVGVINVL